MAYYSDVSRGPRYPEYAATQGQKRCRNCEETQPVAEYYLNKTSADGYASVCKSCYRIKSRENYYANREKIIERVRVWCLEHPDRVRELRRATQAKRRAADPDAARAREREWRRRNPTPYRLQDRRQLLKQYGLTIETYNALAEAQGGKCAICEGPPCGRKGESGARFHVDHCHETGRVRGLLCHRCNTALGSFRDDRELLRRALAYLG